MDVRAHMLVFARISSALTEVLGRDVRANDPRMSAGYPSQKLTLWAAFSFLNCMGQKSPEQTILLVFLPDKSQGPKGRKILKKSYTS